MSDNDRWNLKEKTYYCEKCKTYVKLIARMPKCDECGRGLITVLYSLMDGEVITGNVKLATKISGPARRTGKS